MTESEFVKIIEMLAGLLDPRLIKLLETERVDYRPEPWRTGNDGDKEDAIEKDVNTALQMAHEAGVFNAGNFSTGAIYGMVPRCRGDR